MADPPLSTSQKAWNDFADELKRIGEKIVGPTGARSARERAEGYRYLLRLIAAAHELELEPDRLRPELRRMMTPIRKLKGDGPDTLYHEAKLDPAHGYALDVERGDDLFFSATVYARNETGGFYVVDHLVDEDIEWVERDGRPTATLTISAAASEGATHSMRVAEHEPVLFLRQYFPEPVTAVDDGRHADARLALRCTSDLAAPDPLDEDALAAGLRRVAAFVEENTDVSIGLSVYAGLNTVSSEASVGGIEIAEGRMTDDLSERGEHTPEELAAMVDPKLVANNLPGPGIQYLGAWYRLADDEAVRITGRHVPCRYWSCQVLNRYLESGDYRYAPVAINDRQVKLEADGRFTIYASARNPGVDNWISTEGRSHGHIVLRTLLADPLMEAEFSVVKLSDV
jgi:hypothetical protein